MAASSFGTAGIPVSHCYSFVITPTGEFLLTKVMNLTVVRVWAVRYNTFHDQLVLSSSSDSQVPRQRTATITVTIVQVILSNAASLSSDIYGGLDDDSGDEAESR